MVCNARAFDVLAVYTKASQTACARDFYSIAAGPRVYIFFIGIRNAVLREPSSSTGITAYYSAWEKKNGLYSFASFLWRAHGSNFKNDKYYNEVTYIFPKNCFQSQPLYPYFSENI